MKDKVKMGKVVLFIASSLDGYIATEDGSVAWLDSFQASGDDYGYMDFIKSVGTTIMGGSTYRQALTFGEWSYPGLTSYIVTNQVLADHPEHDVRPYSGELLDLIRQVKSESDKDIFFVGGAQLIKTFIEQDLIDSYMIFVMPVILGKGIPLFLETDRRFDLHLEGVKTYPSGVVELKYSSRRG